MSTNDTRVSRPRASARNFYEKLCFPTISAPAPHIPAVSSPSVSAGKAGCGQSWLRTDTGSALLMPTARWPSEGRGAGGRGAQLLGPCQR